MDRKKTKIGSFNKKVFTVIAFLLTVLLSSIELDLVETPVDSILQTGSAILAVITKPAIMVFKFLF